MKAWPCLPISSSRSSFFSRHWLVYSTLIAFWPGLAPAAVADLRIAMLVLAFSFVVASLLSFRFSNFVVRVIYWLAAVWLGFLNFFFWGSVVIRLAWLAIRFSHLAANPARFPRATCRGSYLLDRGARGNLRVHQCAHHSHSPRHRSRSPICPHPGAAAEQS